MISFSEHSLLKLQQRAISKSLVIKTIQKPDYKASGFSGRKIVYKKFVHLYLKVVFIEKDNDSIITTQCRDKKFKP